MKKTTKESLLSSDYSLYLKMSPEEVRKLTNKRYSSPCIDEIFRDILKEMREEFGEEYLSKSLRVLEKIKRNLVNHMVESDSRVKKNLEEICGNHDQVVYIGGMAHIFSEYPYGKKNLYERLLEDLKPHRLKLSKVDAFVR